MNLRKFYRKIYTFVMVRKKPVKYAKKIGVNFVEGGLYLYGSPSWGSEPWLITIGYNGCETKACFAWRISYILSCDAKDALV